jgi:hypothetical protein
MAMTRWQNEGSHLFLVRLQAEPSEGGKLEWCGKVQGVVSGEAYTFSRWPELIEHLLTMLPELPASHRDARPLPAGDND